MDETDRALISVLKRDARLPVSDLANIVGLSRATVRARIDRLIASGEIVGFTVVTGADVSTHDVRAVMMIEVEGQASDDVIQRLRGMPEVLTIHTTNGRWDLVAEIGARSLQAFDEVLRRIRQVKGITVTETSILLATRKGVVRV